jgi:LCP family protein required for cell wall assembly
MSGPEDPPKYTKYRARPSILSRKRDEPAPAGAPPEGPKRPGLDLPRPRFGGGGPGRGRGISWKRVLKWLAVALAAWILVSIVAFLISAQIQQGQIDDDVNTALAGGGFPVASKTNILVLGSDQRPKGSKEPGASTTGPSRSDSILLLRVGGGANSRLSIARDTLVDIPGASRQKINAAYAIGGAPLAIQTVSQYLHIPIHHVIEVSFSKFPELIDAMGGIDYTGGCVVAKVNGGYKRGGVTIRIKAGEKEHLNGKQALALARVRKNDCNSNENDLTRARRQQRIIASMRSRVLSPSGFARLPWIAWAVPRTFRSDMSGPTLGAVFGSLAVGGTPKTNVLGTPSGEVPDELRRRAVRRFLRG